MRPPQYARFDVVPISKRRLRWELAIVLALSFGYAGVQSIITILRRLSQPDNAFTGERFLMTQVIPLVAARRVSQIRQVGFVAIANIKQIAEHRHRIALLAWPQQFADRDMQGLAQ